MYKTCLNCYSRAECNVAKGIHSLVIVEDSDKIFELLGDACTEYNVGSKESNIRNLFASYNRLEFFKSQKHPVVEHLVEEEQKILDKYLVRLKEAFNVEGMNYIKSEGSSDYLLFCAEKIQKQIDDDRCDKCMSLNDNMDCEKGLDKTLSCEGFEDCGYSMSERIQDFQMFRCSKCINNVIILHAEVDELRTTKCKLGLNTLNPDCSSFAPLTIGE